MMNIKEAMLLYAVTDRRWTGDTTLKDQVKSALDGGITCVQLREKDINNDEFIREALDIKELCKEYNVPFIINDNVDIAIKSGADGVHVGQSDMKAKNVRELVGDKMIVGVSAQTVDQAIAAQEAGADYIGVGAVFSTVTKEDAEDVSKDVLCDICRSVKIPVVAIGGINRNNMLDLKGTGIDGVALVSSVFAANDIEKECKILKRLSMNTVGVVPKALSIAGSDSSGGAGIQADIKTMISNGVYSMTAITALTAQNTMGVTGIFETTPEFLESQLDAVFGDITPDAVKIGMVSSVELVKVISRKLKEYKAKNIVVDPVMVATSGSRLIETEAIKTLTDELFPVAALITPNIPEAEVLSGIKISDSTDMEKAALKLNKKFGCNVLLKGGHSVNDANDLLCCNGEIQWICGKRINSKNTHGTGCTLSSAIASNLAKGYDVCDSVKRAKQYIEKALEYGLNLGYGSGPLMHGGR